jgi:TnpA family transposase
MLLTAGAGLLYRAFRELGRVERTLFLLRYISNTEVRRMICAETTKMGQKAHPRKTVR